MIHLELTLPECDLLLQHLQAETGSPSPNSASMVGLLRKVVTARQSALQQQTCPVCGHIFDQLKVGRSGRYCSNACRQKAYRQRRLDSLRKGYPPPGP